MGGEFFLYAGKMINAYAKLVDKTERKRPVDRHTNRWEVNNFTGILYLKT
jgi:hypothetical protein